MISDSSWVKLRKETNYGPYILLKVEAGEIGGKLARRRCCSRLLIVTQQRKRGVSTKLGGCHVLGVSSETGERDVSGSWGKGGKVELFYKRVPESEGGGGKRGGGNLRRLEG